MAAPVPQDPACLLVLLAVNHHWGQPTTSSHESGLGTGGLEVDAEPLPKFWFWLSPLGNEELLLPISRRGEFLVHQQQLHLPQLLIRVGGSNCNFGLLLFYLCGCKNNGLAMLSLKEIQCLIRQLQFPPRS